MLQNSSHALTTTVSASESAEGEAWAESGRGCVLAGDSLSTIHYLAFHIRWHKDHDYDDDWRLRWSSFKSKARARLVVYV
jgi:hypothetical protein